MRTKLLAVAIATLALTVGGAAAVSGTVQQGTGDATANDAAVDATYTNGTVTEELTITSAGESINNAIIEVDDEEYKMDATSTVSADVEREDCLEIEVEAVGFEAEQEYRLSDCVLTLLEEYEYG